MDQQDNQEAPEGQQNGQGAEAGQQPEVDELENAYRTIAEREGWDPRLTRFQMDELKSRREELDRRERELQRELDSRRTSRREPEFDRTQLDPQVAYLDQKIDSRLAPVLEFIEEQRQAREAWERADRDGATLRQSYELVMRQSGVPEREIEGRAGRFFQEMERLYPDGIPERIGPEGAVRNTYQFMTGGRSSNSPPVTTTTRVTPRTSIVTAQGTGPVEDRSDLGPQRQGESNNDYAQRVMRNYEALGLKGLGLRDGEKISSE